MRARLLRWPAVVALLVLTARWLAYALAPSPLARVLEHSAGGPSLVVVTLVSLGLAVLGSAFVVWLVALGVRERARLAPERVAPSLRLRRLALRAAALYVASSLAFAMFESYLHWRAGIGFHGLSCLVGPVHRNAIPLLAALALAAAALAEAVEHLVAWMRAVVRELRRRRLAPQRFVLLVAASTLAPSTLAVPSRSRGPPLAV
ncbi:MAG TPA: hypothetical protein VGP56_07490 [Gaiellaceae bacterium]|jgi:hypothetical protein|nr:hypothetical protein [Gaiellaceae bacterium]